MGEIMIKRSLVFFEDKPVLFSIVILFLSWSGTWGIAKLIWHDSLPQAGWATLLAALLIPLALVAAITLLAKKQNGKFNLVGWFFVAEFLFVAVNLFRLHWHINNYGDYGQLSLAIEQNTVFPRWMLGSSLLNDLFRSIIASLPIHLSSDFFVRIAGSFFMCLFSFLLIRRYPTRLAMILPLLTPIWLILAIGYDEYYPYLAPFIIVVLVLLSENLLKKSPPLFFGLFIACLSLLYAGVQPFSLFLMIIYFIRRGIKDGLAALGCSLIWMVLLLVVFWPGSISSFVADFRGSLNLDEPGLYPGQNLAGTPFFAPLFAFSSVNLQRLSYMYFWAGGCGLLLALVSMVFFFVKTRTANFKSLTFVSLGLLFLWQLVYFMFMIPRLGAVNDIDLFFSVYLCAAFMAGWFVDELVKESMPARQLMIKSAMIAFFTGSTTVSFLYLAILGLPLPGVS